MKVSRWAIVALALILTPFAMNARLWLSTTLLLTAVLIGAPTGPLQARAFKGFHGQALLLGIVFLFAGLIATSLTYRATPAIEAALQRRIAEREQVARAMIQKAGSSAAGRVGKRKVEDGSTRAENAALTGDHCLSRGDGSHDGFVRSIKRKLLDPKSFSHESTRITRLASDGTRTLIMTYRVRNVPGRLSVENASAKIRGSDCALVSATRI